MLHPAAKFLGRRAEAAARNGQTQKEGLVDQLAGQLEPLRLALCAALYKNLASLMVLFAANPPEVAAFFDLTLIMAPPGGGEEEPPPPPPPLPGAATLGGVASDGQGNTVFTGMAAEGAASFQPQVLVPGAAEFADLGGEVAGPDATIPTGFTPGEFQGRVAGVNSSGRGPWSEAVPFTVT